jgi:hypothetical protein
MDVHLPAVSSGYPTDLGVVVSARRRSRGSRVTPIGGCGSAVRKLNYRSAFRRTCAVSLEPTSRMMRDPPGAVSGEDG